MMREVWETAAVPQKGHIAQCGSLWYRAGQKQKLGRLKRGLDGKSAVFPEIPGVSPGFWGVQSFLIDRELI